MSHSQASHITSVPSPILEKSFVGIPPTLIPLLLEVYFSHIYNASLLLHRPAFLRGLAADAIRPDVLLSVCAFAAKFYRDAQGRRSLMEDGFACEWAERAGRLAFQEVESPKDENIVSFINLALFWYSEGTYFPNM